MRIASVGKAFPDHYYDQETLLGALRRYWEGRGGSRARLEALHRRVLVGGRYLALPVDAYDELENWGQANDAWVRVAQQVGERAIMEALDAAGLSVADVNTLIFVSVTGVAVPSVDARLMNRLGLPSHVKRVPIFGLGCVAGTAGIARAADYVRAFPDQVAVLLSVELCSLTLQRDDLSVANLVASGLFGDGAAAAVVVGEEHPASGPRIVDSRSVFYPETEDLMGWEISERGFRVVLSAAVPQVVRDHLGRDVDAFLEDNGIDRTQIDHWISHPGGPKVLTAMQETFGLREDNLSTSWRTLRELGNLSSASVLMVLSEVLDSKPAQGDYGLMLAMGPGFCSELVLLRW